MTPVLRGMLLDIAPPLVGYYGLRALGVSEYIALLTATVLAGIKVGYDAIKARRLDPFAGYLMLNFGLSLAVGLATHDARMLMVGDTLVGGIGALIFLGSCVIGKPLTQVVAERVQPADERSREEPTGTDERSREEPTGSNGSPEPGEADFKHRVHVLLSAIWGVGLLVGMFVSLGIIFSFSVDVGKGVNTAVSLAVTAVLILVTIVVAKRARARWEQRSASQS
ncbi:VC0807 family protein [Mycolicibacterium sp. 120266]|uniref:VC0807 family protein n=1 Tax=Mycolicibacterium sp. 120266 TaxID=3090601 RepID=UPI00299DB299|nr:VC0807 family protein [Mycolicibacterium sp. 120266]MDX1872392.1 VC0807 family protein [Mycolicibacterium sp. 120266]